jgi:hypothetical protein
MEHDFFKSTPLTQSGQRKILTLQEQCKQHLTNCTTKLNNNLAYLAKLQQSHQPTDPLYIKAIQQLTPINQRLQQDIAQMRQTLGLPEQQQAESILCFHAP